MIPPFTVFTSTDNRVESLKDCYRGLCVQTLTDFEWVIVDDGSTDHTRELVAEWQREAGFPIRYSWQENQGKPTAHNRGVQEA